ncbi:MAG: helix-turn-helix transcriptional regulator [Alphaproteobacteria bacterium]|nr:helix-turn-helix transcriptional regulator [Alphaproteobacteria bacterium]
MPDRQQRPAPEPRPPLDRREDAILSASHRALDLLLERRASDLSVKELAAHLELSERTFYRYFPRKELVIRPALLAALEAVAADIRTYPRARPLQEALIVAHDRAYESGQAHWDALMPLLRADDALMAVWHQLMGEAEQAMSEAIAERLGIPSNSTRAALMGAVLTVAGRLAVERASSPEEPRSPGEILPELLTLLGGGLFEGC